MENHHQEDRVPDSAHDEFVRLPGLFRRWEIEQVVDPGADFHLEEAGDALRAMNAENTPKFQTKLRTLKDRRKWTHDQFMREAAPYVQDDKILGLDEQTATLLNKIQGLGEGGAGREPDCGLLDVLRTHMHALIETTEAKWSYMNSKIDQALVAAQ